MRRRGWQRRGSSATAPPAQSDWRSYDDVADEFERLHTRRTSMAAADLVRFAEIPAGGRVLDVGTGTGVAAIAAAEHAGPDGLVVGVDRSEGMLRLAGEKGTPVHLIAAEAIDLPFRDGTFDIVLANFVLSHFTRYETALFDMTRVLRPSGRVAVSAWASHEDEFSRVWREVAEGFIGKDMMGEATRRGCPWEERFSEPRGLQEALRGADLRPRDVEKTEYRLELSREDYLAGRETGSVSRFMRQMLGDGSWERFRARVREEFASRFPERFGDTWDVLIAVATKR